MLGLLDEKCHTLLQRFSPKKKKRVIETSWTYAASQNWKSVFTTFKHLYARLKKKKNCFLSLEEMPKKDCQFFVLKIFLSFFFSCFLFFFFAVHLQIFRFKVIFLFTDSWTYDVRFIFIVFWKKKLLLLIISSLKQTLRNRFSCPSLRSKLMITFITSKRFAFLQIVMRKEYFWPNHR